ncbi:hypothetical protein PROFUN_09830 [Planoprotostelium fungivorum]|uniref:urocanate hydratase n=1 Tax=Planoprotostelium fungivorum TaxID=1890364 RepID=A0A2P6NFP3_9EUKA|nr:hypothetical protein PROFUN_09830 [Planoprotostelium fungivorum]
MSSRLLTSLKKVPVEVYPVVASVVGGCVLSGWILVHNFNSSHEFVINKKKGWPYMEEEKSRNEYIKRLFHKENINSGDEIADRRKEESDMSATQTQTTIQGPSTTIDAELDKIKQIFSEELTAGIPEELPEMPQWDESIPHAPKRPITFTEETFKLAIRNALRYFPSKFHAQLAIEFADELRKYGHIYMYRLRPTSYEVRAYPIDVYPARCRQAAAIMLMIHNNLDKKVAQYPHELVTYGGNGSVFSNWAQYRLMLKYLSEMTEEQTLVMYSGHPMGLYPSHPGAPRVVVTNGMVIPNYSSKADYETMYATGVSIYGQMTAGSYCYIGPQGIVHGTTITVMNAGRKYLGVEDLRGKVFITSGLGGMSGAQGKAGVICNSVTVVAEVNEAALRKRYDQGWIMEIVSGLDQLVERLKKARQNKEVVSIAYHGNIVDIWERLAVEDELLVELGSDQTSLHNPYHGGYYPVGLSFEESNQMMVENPDLFKEKVQESLRRQIEAINTLSSRGMKFWDYGNSFLLEASRAKANVMDEKGKFKYPSYVQDIMGDIFSLGFGPFRWVCTSGDITDLDTTDAIAADIIESIMKKEEEKASSETKKREVTKCKLQHRDNHQWIKAAKSHQMVVGSKARILYSNAPGRRAIAAAFNEAVRDGRVKAPIVIRETSNVYDGSHNTADMAVQNFVGDSFRGATWVALHNGGGTGWGESINGGFGLVLDGTPDAGRRADLMLGWDVLNGVSRRAWARNENAEDAITAAMEEDEQLVVTLPHHASDDVLEAAYRGGK